MSADRGYSPAENTGSSLIIHHLNDSRSQRILWLAEELGLKYEIKKYDRDSNQRAPRELLAISPLGKAPVITDGSVTLAESGAIVEYIMMKYGKSEASQLSDSGKIDNLYFTHYAEGSLMPILVFKLVFTMIPTKSPAFLRPLVRAITGKVESTFIEPELKRHCEFIESHLAKVNGGWLAGGSEPTTADYMMSFPLEAMASSKEPCIGPKTKEYVDRIHARPAYQRGLQKGGEYKFSKL